MWLTQDSLIMYYKIFKLGANLKNNCKSQYATTIQSKTKTKKTRMFGRAAGKFYFLMV